MDQKFRSGDPFSGKPMKQFGEDDENPLPAPPKIDEVVAAGEEVLKQEVDPTPAEYVGMRCPCGKEWKDCAGFFGIMDRDETFKALKEGRIQQG